MMQNLMINSIDCQLSCSAVYVRHQPDVGVAATEEICGTLSTIHYPPSMQVALFGTSADPPTIAHQEIISWLASKFVGAASPQENRVAVWAADNPFKVHGASLEQRSQMLELLISEINPSISHRVQVYPNLSSQYTIESLITAKTIWSDADFVLVVGADLIAQLPKWYRVTELLAQVKLLIIPRTGNEIAQTSLDTLTDLGAQISIAPLATPAISSTIVRTNHSTRASIQGLTPAVARYIQDRKLYEMRTDI
jgi:nicotinate-nucleotide adenylyltransferase